MLFTEILDDSDIGEGWTRNTHGNNWSQIHRSQLVDPYLFTPANVLSIKLLMDIYHDSPSFKLSEKLNQPQGNWSQMITPLARNCSILL